MRAALAFATALLVLAMATPALAARVVVYVAPATSAGVYKQPVSKIVSGVYPVYVPELDTIAYAKFFWSISGMYPGYDVVVPVYDHEHGCLRGSEGWTQVLANYTLVAGSGLDRRWYTLLREHLNVTLPGCSVDPLVFWWAVHGKRPSRPSKIVSINVSASLLTGSRMTRFSFLATVELGREWLKELPEVEFGAVYKCVDGRLVRVSPYTNPKSAVYNIGDVNITVYVVRLWRSPEKLYYTYLEVGGRRYLLTVSRAYTARVYCGNGTLVVWLGAVAVAVNPPQDADGDGIPDELEHMACVSVEARGDFASAYWVAATNTSAVESLPEPILRAVLTGVKPEPTVVRLEDAIDALNVSVPAPLPYPIAAVLAASAGRYNYAPYTACDALEHLTGDEPGARATLAYNAALRSDCRGVEVAITGSIYEVYEVLASYCGNESVAYAAGASLLSKAKCSSEAVAAVSRVAPDAVSDICGHTVTTTVTKTVTKTMTVTVTAGAAETGSTRTTGGAEGARRLLPGEAVVVAAAVNGVVAAYIARLLWRRRGA